MSKPPARTIVIGDVHGCFLELKALLKKLSVRATDQVIATGDLIGKGPDSLGVLEWAMSVKNFTSVRGNYEQRFLRYWKSGDMSKVRPGDRKTLRQLHRDRKRFARLLRKWPLYLKRRGFVVVHAGFDPRGGRLERKKARELTTIRLLKDIGQPWYERYRGRSLVLFGHWARPQALRRKNAVGLDTGCVYGGRLSALVLPERRLVSVRARRRYRKKYSWSKILDKRQ